MLPRRPVSTIATQRCRPAMFPGVVIGLVLALEGTAALRAQDLAPRAYLITPVHTTAVTVGNSFNDGNLLFEGTVPITDATGRLDVSTVTYYRSFDMLGRSANITATLPYGVGTFEGTVLGAEKSADRSGFLDAALRLSVNLTGGPAMSLAEMRQWQQENTLGVSLKVIAPTGEYDPTKLINLGSNRWSLKPEVGFSHRWKHWVIDTYGSVWFFTKNPAFFSYNEFVPGAQSQTQDPIAAVELHVSYDIRPRLWISFDANFWHGGRTSLNGVENSETLLRNSRIGMTASLPVSRHQSLKVGYAQGAYIRFGGDYRIYSAGWQYSWIGKPD